MLSFKFFKRFFEPDQFKMIHTANSITIKIKSRKKPFTMRSDHQLYEELVEAIKQKDHEAVLNVIAIAERITVAMQGHVEVKNGLIYHNGEPCNNIVAKRIMQFMAEGIPCSYLVKFLERVMENPLESARNELFLFLENGDLPIMDDGRFQAYKWVDPNLLDCRTHAFDNSPGQIVSMPREQCDTDRRELCSSGLHVCTQYYTKFGERLVLVAVAPEDVVAVPADYNNAKMRTWQYEVLEEISAESYGHIKERALVQYRKFQPEPEPQPEAVVEEPKAVETVDKLPDPIKIGPPKKKGKQMTPENWTKFKQAVKSKKSTAGFGLSDCEVKEFRKKAREELANGQV